MTNEELKLRLSSLDDETLVARELISQVVNTLPNHAIPLVAVDNALYGDDSARVFNEGRFASIAWVDLTVIQGRLVGVLCIDHPAEDLTGFSADDDDNED